MLGSVLESAICGVMPSSMKVIRARMEGRDNSDNAFCVSLNAPFFLDFWQCWIRVLGAAFGPCGGGGSDFQGTRFFFLPTCARYATTPPVCPFIVEDWLRSWLALRQSKRKVHNTWLVLFCSCPWNERDVCVRVCLCVYV